MFLHYRLLPKNLHILGIKKPYLASSISFYSLSCLGYRLNFQYLVLILLGFFILWFKYLIEVLIPSGQKFSDSLYFKVFFGRILIIWGPLFYFPEEGLLIKVQLIGGLLSYGGISIRAFYWFRGSNYGFFSGV